MTPAELIESARLCGAHLDVNQRDELEFSAPGEWYMVHKEEMKKHHRAIVLLLKFQSAARQEMGKVLPFRRKAP